jgi:uncharacterized Tic20 family protein
LLGSCVSAGISLYRAFTTELVLDSALDPGAGSTVEATLDHETRLRVALVGEIDGRSVQEITNTPGREYQLRYRIPISYRIEQTGRVLLEEQTVVAWDRGGLSFGDKGVGPGGGTIETTKTLTRISAGPGPISVSVETGEDTDYQATLGTLHVEIYRDVVHPLAAMLRWFLLLAGGVVALVVALVLWLIVAGRDSAPRTGSTDQARQLAACCHAAGLIGFVIPLGNLFVPLLLWLMLRETDDFIDRQGKEAVNFQLSFTCYYLLGVLLILALIGIVLLLIVFVLHLTFTIIATVQSFNGVDYRYPLTIRLIR